MDYLDQKIIMVAGLKEHCESNRHQIFAMPDEEFWVVRIDGVHSLRRGSVIRCYGNRPKPLACYRVRCARTMAELAPILLGVTYEEPVEKRVKCVKWNGTVGYLVSVDESGTDLLGIFRSRESALEAAREAEFNGDCTL